MSASTRKDINYWSFSKGLWTKDAGSDNPKTFTESPGNVFVPEQPKNYASALKFSNGRIHLIGITVSQCKENAVDVNTRSNVTLTGEFGSDKDNFGDQVISVKGESYCKLKGTIRGSGKRYNADVLIGQWSDQEYGSSTVDLTELKHADGRKIRVVKRLFSAKVKHSKNVKTLWLPSIGMTAYVWFKFCVRKVSGIKRGEKGPSWL